MTKHLSIRLSWGSKTLWCQQDKDWLLLLGSGIHGEGGALLLYRSQSLSSGQHICPAPFAIYEVVMAAIVVDTHLRTGYWPASQAAGSLHRRVGVRGPAVRGQAGAGGGARHRRHVGVPLLCAAACTRQLRCRLCTFPNPAVWFHHTHQCLTKRN